MKNLLFGLIATVVFGFVGNAQNVMKYEDFGFYHNETLIEFTRKFGENQHSVDFILDESLKLMQTKYPNIFHNAETAEIKTLFKVKNSKDFDFTNIWNSNIQLFSADKRLSSRVIDLITTILNGNGLYNDSMNILVNFEAHNQLTQEEKNCLIAIKSVLKSSNEYWSASSRKALPGSKTMIADFGAAACFMFAGPVAAIAGFAASYITHQNDH